MVAIATEATPMLHASSSNAAGRAVIAFLVALGVLAFLALGALAVVSRTEFLLAKLLGLGVMGACVSGMAWIALDSERDPQRWPFVAVAAVVGALLVAALGAGVAGVVIGIGPGD